MAKKKGRPNTRMRPNLQHGDSAKPLIYMALLRSI
jgi:hypothetical protein